MQCSALWLLEIARGGGNTEDGDDDDSDDGDDRNDEDDVSSVLTPQAALHWARLRKLFWFPLQKGC